VDKQKSTICSIDLVHMNIYIYIYIYIYIENADATPPHLKFFLRLGSSDGVHGSLQFFAMGLFSPIFFRKLRDPGAVLGCHQAPKTVILKACWLHFGHRASILVVQVCTWAANGRIEARSSIFVGLGVHFRIVFGFTLGSLVVLVAPWEAFLCPWPPKREARRIQKAISGQHKGNDICTRFTVFSEVTDHKCPIWGRTSAHAGHFSPHVGAMGAPSGAFECHWVSQSVPKCCEVTTWSGQGGSRWVEVGQWERFAAGVGPSGGGGGFASELCKDLYTIIQHALLPLTRCGGS